MRKDDLYNVYSILNDCKDTITNLLPKIQFLRGEEAELFNKICLNYSDYINEYNLESVLDMCLSLKKVCNIENAKMVSDEIYETLENKNLLLNEWFITYMDNVTEIIRDRYVFESFEDNYNIGPDDYTIEMIINLSNLFKYSDSDEDISHDQDYFSIMESYKYVLRDLKYTKTNVGESSNLQRLQRLDAFTKLITNSKVMNLREDKYMAVLDVACSIDENKKLSKFSSILKNDTFLNSDDFKEKIESYTDEYNQNTFTVLQKENNNDYFKKILKNDKQQKVYKL